MLLTVLWDSTTAALATSAACVASVAVSFKDYTVPYLQRSFRVSGCWLVEVNHMCSAGPALPAVTATSVALPLLLT